MLLCKLQADFDDLFDQGIVGLVIVTRLEIDLEEASIGGVAIWIWDPACLLVGRRDLPKLSSVEPSVEVLTQIALQREKDISYESHGKACSTKLTSNLRFRYRLSLTGISVTRSEGSMLMLARRVRVDDPGA